MFICSSICDETFVGVHQNSTYAIQCDHVFHYQCLMKLLKKSPTCPHCGTLVLINSLVKLQDDPKARVKQDGKTDEEISTLKEQIKILKEKEALNSNLINYLKTQLKHTKRSLDISNRSVNVFKNEAENQRKNNSDIFAELKLMTVKYNVSEINGRKFQAGYLLLQSIIKSLKHQLYNLQSSNSSYIDILKLEIADLKSESAYFQSRCMANIKLEHPSSSKIFQMNIENKNAILLQIQSKNKYYGHDPQLHIPTKQFLLGCVFLFVEDQIQHEDFNICNNTIISKDNIIKHGGSVEQNYSVRVTHIICITQQHKLVEQGINDGKRCVTDYWLMDIFAKKSMIPPWLAIHFPIQYSIEYLPCQQFQFSIINFGINERQIIKAMIELVGGNHVTEVTSRTDIVVCLKLEGELVKKALAINKPVVNVHWLSDILFGEKLGIKNPGNLKYQQFDQCNPFLVNYDMVSHLMEAWKTPLTFCANLQLDDLIIIQNSPIKCERLKNISDETQEMINVINDDNDIIIAYKKTSLCVMFSGFSSEDKEKLKMILFLFGGAVASHYYEATHLIMKNPITSTELYCCLSTVKYILNANWLNDSYSNLKLQDEKKYVIENIQHIHLGLCNIPSIIKNNRRHLLFRNLSFFVTPGIKYPPSICLEQIIFSAGGSIERTRRSLQSIRGLAPNSYFIISRQEDHYLYNDLLGISHVVYFPEFITSSILMQRLLLQTFFVEIISQD